MGLRATCAHVGAGVVIGPSGLVCSRCDAPIVDDAAPRLHSQKDGERPVGVGPTKYLRGWRRGRDAGDPEVTADGRARLMTPAAWARHGATPSKTKPRTKVVLLRTNEDDVAAAELGLERKRTA